MNYEVNPKIIVTPDTISLDTEYTDLNIRKADLLSVSIGVSSDLTYIFDRNHLEEISRLITNAKTVYMWNMTVDVYMLQKTHISIDTSKVLDAMLMEHLVDERLTHSLGEFALREYNDNYKEEFWKEYKSYQDAPKEVAYEYEMRDGCYTFFAGTKYNKLLCNKTELVRHVHRLAWALFDTEIKGIAVNLPLMQSTKTEMSQKINEYLPKLREEFHDYCTIWELNKWTQEIAKRTTEKGKSRVARPAFKFTSDRQISELLFGEQYLSLPSKEKTKKGSPSTSFDSLKALSEEHPQIRTIVDYKEVKAVYATFVEGMLERVENERIYPSFFVNGTATGRISHGNPNLGNLPREGVIRNFFVPDAGYRLVGADYSQLEVVVEANLTKDPSLLKIILEGASKHDITANGLGITREQAKTLNFALQYGAGVFKVSKILGISGKDAQDIFDRYWKLYSGVKALKDSTDRVLLAEGCVTNCFGRTRHFDKPKNEYEKAKQSRQAYNHLIQGVGADMMNMASYTIAERFARESIGRFLWSVHDEALCEVKDSLIDYSRDVIIELMGVPNEALNLKYPVQCKLYGPLKCWAKT